MDINIKDAKKFVTLAEDLAKVTDKSYEQAIEAIVYVDQTSYIFDDGDGENPTIEAVVAVTRRLDSLDVEEGSDS